MQMPIHEMAHELLMLFLNPTTGTSRLKLSEYGTGVSIFIIWWVF